MKVSICIAAYGKPLYLEKVLASIFCQKITFDYEVIVVDDGSPDSGIWNASSLYPVRYKRITRTPGYRNPAVARNVAYKLALGEVIIAQSDDTVHASSNCIERLVTELMPGHFVIANVFNTDFNGNVVPGNLDNPTYNPLIVYTGPTNQRPYFFLGSLYREDLYAVGGNDEEFIQPGREDRWFADCLIHGRGLLPIYSTTIVGYHIQHRHFGTTEDFKASRAVYQHKYARALRGEGQFCASGGPWAYS